MYIDGAEEPIGKGTCFTYTANPHKFHLITNWHNVTGRNPNTNESLNSNGLADPDYIKIHFNTKILNKWVVKEIRLKDENGSPIWKEHPRGREVDVVAIPIEYYNDVYFRCLCPLNMEVKLSIYPSKAVSILGFPKGLSSGGKYPIWKKGHLASEPYLDYNNLPIILIDATTRSGMSGSPVILYESGMAAFEGNSVAQGTYIRFLGIYSGRIDGEVEIGRVWKANVLNDII